MFARKKIIVSLFLAVSSNAFGRDLPCETDHWLDVNKSLLIRDLSVVNSPQATGDGPWSFAAAMTAALGPSPDIGSRVYTWIDQFGSLLDLNGYPLHARTPGHLLENWPRRGGQTNQTSSDLDLARAPFRLLAIAFRTDLATLGKPAGEGRIIFGATNPQTDIKQLTVIFEFDLPVGVMTPNDEVTTREFWQQKTAELSLLPFGLEYQTKLLALTDLFLATNGQRPSLAQVRTNEQYFGPGWDLREFRLDPATRSLKQVPVEQTPDLSLDSRTSNDLVNWINENRTAILENAYQLPDRFLGGSAFLDDDRFGWFLQNPHLEPDVRRAFALNTCNGCHGRETRTRFQHVEPRSAWQVSNISDFMRRELGTRANLLTKAVCEE